MSDVLPDNCRWGVTHEPVHCCGAISKSGFPTIQASSCAQHPSDALKLPGTTICLPSDHLVQIHDGQCLSNKKKNQQHLDLWLTHPCFFCSRRPFPHPLRRLHLGFTIILVNSCLISCYNVLRKAYITICIGKQLLTDFNKVLFLIVSQQMWHEFCTDAMQHLKFFNKNLRARSYADAHFVSNFLESWTKISTNHSTNSLDMVVVCCCGSSSRPGIFNDKYSALFKTLKPLIALCWTHTVLPVCLVKRLKCL